MKSASIKDLEYVVAQIESVLRSSEGMALVRNAPLLESLIRGGDVDIVVNSVAKSRSQVEAVLGPACRVVRRSYLTGIYYSWGHIDLMPTLEWRGAPIVPVRTLDLLSESEIIQGVKVIRPAHRAMHSWFSSVLWGGFLKLKYREDIKDWYKAEPMLFRRLLDDAIGPRNSDRFLSSGLDTGFELSAKSVRRLRLNWRAQAAKRSPIRFICGLLRFWFFELRLFLNPAVPEVEIFGPWSASSDIEDVIRGEAQSASFAGVNFHSIGGWFSRRRFRMKGVLPVIYKCSASTHFRVTVSGRGFRIVRQSEVDFDGEVYSALANWCRAAFPLA